MWFNLKPYIGIDFDVKLSLINGICIKKDILKEHKDQVGGKTVYVLAIMTSGMPVPITITFNTLPEAEKLKEEIKNA